MLTIERVAEFGTVGAYMGTETVFVLRTAQGQFFRDWSWDANERTPKILLVGILGFVESDLRLAESFLRFLT